MRVTVWRERLLVRPATPELCRRAGFHGSYWIPLFVLLGLAHLMALLPRARKPLRQSRVSWKRSAPRSSASWGRCAACMANGAPRSSSTIPTQHIPSRCSSLATRRSSCAGMATPRSAGLGGPPAGRQDSVEFAVKRRRWRITLICNDRVVAQCYDDSLTGGRTGWQADSGRHDLRLQAQSRSSSPTTSRAAQARPGSGSFFAGTGQVAGWRLPGTGRMWAATAATPSPGPRARGLSPCRWPATGSGITTRWMSP